MLYKMRLFEFRRLPDIITKNNKLKSVKTVA